MSDKTILVWFRKDLRIHDNEILLEASRKADFVIPFYCFDERHFQPASFNTLKTGVFRAQFLLESVADLKQSLQQLGGDLLISKGLPEEIIPALVQKYKVCEVYHHREVASEETGVSENVERALWKQKINLKHFIGHTLYHKEDLPFPIKDIPDVFTTFRKKVERESRVKPCFETPQIIRKPANLESSKVPDLYELGFTQKPVADPRSAIEIKGGESNGTARLKSYFWDTDSLKNYKNTRNGLIGSDYSSKFSSWLSLGCLSPREIYWEIKKYERERIANDSTYWLSFELLWRDYFRFMFKKHGNKFFQKRGFKDSYPEEAENQVELFECWKSGQTGIPFIDANMRELNATGFMSNRGRQNVASFLIKDLKVNWTWGAAYFEEQLIDYCPSSNWGNWAYVAGVGNDPRDNRYFNVLKQAREYDPLGDYVRLWIPELKNIPLGKIHEPWKLPADRLADYQVTIGKSYPNPLSEIVSY
ncbi:DASH family cryptochrome [Daejeonella oryzae]|uniref:DASH family cryptochrome n=1 Tax=Daejeonella oryzae TaxID=1122943 RepID=UPI000408564F|nr:DASH family cryptochrome [Daejeonella oryzae]